MSYTFVGDIHGCKNELDTLYNEYLLRIINRGDSVIFLGDIVDRGPESIECVKMVAQLMKENPDKVHCLRGNHEDWYLRFIRHERKNKQSGKLNPMKAIKKKIDLIKDLEEEYFSWLESLPIFFSTDKITAVHGGIPSSVQEIHQLSTSRYASRVLRIRMVDRENKMVSLGHEKDEHHHWSEKYDGRFGVVVYGHFPNNSVNRQKFATGIDTSCCFGGALTALTIDANGDEVGFFQVEAKEKYSNSFEDHGFR